MKLLNITLVAAVLISFLQTAKAEGVGARRELDKYNQGEFMCAKEDAAHKRLLEIAAKKDHGSESSHVNSAN